MGLEARGRARVAALLASPRREEDIRSEWLEDEPVEPPRQAIPEEEDGALAFLSPQPALPFPVQMDAQRPELLWVPASASREEFASRLFGDASAAGAFHFEPREPPADGVTGLEVCVRVLHPLALVSEQGIRAIEVPEARILEMVSLANLDDWELGFRLLQALAADPAAEVEGEDGTVGALSDIRARFQEVLLREVSTGFLSIQKQLDEHPAMMVVLHCPIRHVFIGRRCLAEISMGTSNEIISLMERIRRIQYIESEEFEVRQPIGLMASAGVRISLWAPEKAQAFEPTDYLGLRGTADSLTIPVASLPTLVGTRFQWLDEKQFLIQATPASELSSLHSHAETLAVNPFAKLKKWWQFWK